MGDFVFITILMFGIIVIYTIKENKMGVSKMGNIKVISSKGHIIDTYSNIEKFVKYFPSYGFISDSDVKRMVKQYNKRGYAVSKCKRFIISSSKQKDAESGDKI